MLSPGQDHDLTCAEPLIEAVDPGALIADKAFDADPFIAALDARAIGASHPTQIQPKNPAPVRFRPLLRTQSQRAVLQQAQTFPGHRPALRQARQDFPRRRSARLRRHPPQLNTDPSAARDSAPDYARDRYEKRYTFFLQGSVNPKRHARNLPEFGESKFDQFQEDTVNSEVD